jgi:ABC-type molybdate transport system substrate-binding protein
VSDSAPARDLLAFLAAPEARAVWSSQGFAVPN